MALIDDVISAINATLTANLAWIDNAYGSVQRLSETKDGRPYRYPAIFVGENTKDYLNMLPDNHLGNYCYWEVAENQDYENENRNIRPVFFFKLVFWFDWRELYPADWKARSIEEVKAQILAVLVAAPYSRMVETFKIFEDADSIYRGFTHQEASRNFMMRPYGGLAIVGELVASTACDLSIPTVLIASSPVSSIFTHSLTAQVWPYEKWLGSETIFCRTWQFSSGGVVANRLTGLDVSTKFPIRFDARYMDAGSGDVSLVTTLSEGATDFEISTPSNSADIYVTVWWIATTGGGVGGGGS